MRIILDSVLFRSFYFICLKCHKSAQDKTEEVSLSWWLRVIVQLSSWFLNHYEVPVPPLCPTLCDSVAPPAPLSLEFPRQECWGGLPFPTPVDHPPGIEPRSPALQADSLLSAPPGNDCGMLLSIKSLFAFYFFLFMCCQVSVSDAVRFAASLFFNLG